MHLLFETAAGFALFQVKGGEKFVEEAKDLGAEFASLEAAKKVVKLKGFRPFENITQALECAAATMDNKLSKDLKKALKKAEGSTLAVADAKLGNIIKDKLGIACVHGSGTMELMRGVRSQLEGLLEKEDVDLAPMSLGLSHSLSRYKLKFSADKVDTMIIQAIGLLDDLDKQLNIYAMRVREWYGWHFPEMVKVLSDNVLYAKVIQQVGFREAIPTAELSGLLDEDVEAALKEAALLSMGTEISQSDLDHVQDLATQVIALSDYRAEGGRAAVHGHRDQPERPGPRAGPGHAGDCPLGVPRAALGVPAEPHGGRGSEPHGPGRRARGRPPHLARRVSD